MNQQYLNPSAMPAPAPMPQGVPMGGGGSPYRPAPVVTGPMNPPMQPPQGPPAPPPNATGMGGVANPLMNAAQGVGSMFGMGGGTAPNGIGPNGFGVHPDVSHDRIVDYLLPKFKSVESTNNYQAKNRTPGMTASGAYGYTNPTWNNYKGYPRAMDAPPEVQDERMKNDIMSSLHRFQGDPFKAVANHYYPRYATDPTKWEQPIVGKSGTPIHGADTVRQYLEKVLPPERVGKYLASVGASS